MEFDILFIVSSGIGNVIEMLYAVEYAMKRPMVKVAIYVENIPPSFMAYLKDCYGDVVLDHIDDVSTCHLVHSMTVEKHVSIPFKHYFYIKPDRYSSSYLSETEQAISVVQALYPGGELSTTLHFLRSEKPNHAIATDIFNRIIIYPGCSPISPVKRWPYFKELIEEIGESNAIVVGGKEDLDFSASYVFPQWFTRFVPQAILNNKKVWEWFKTWNLLKKYSHWSGMEKLDYVYIERFTWTELVWLFRNAKQYIGNDGGLTHLAGASGAKGIVIFGPTSIEKNRPLNPNIQIVSNRIPCSPCQFAVANIQMTKGYINCPYQVKCLADIPIGTVLSLLSKK